MISIVIPVFNSMDTLDEAFQSARTSGIADQEIILVDDGSTDGSWDVIRRYAAQYPNVVALRHERNRGGGAARNTGIRAARHDLLFVLDSDDLLAGNGALLRAVELLIADPSIDGLVSGTTYFFRDTVEKFTSVTDHAKKIGHFSDLLLSDAVNYHGNLLVRRKVFDGVGGYPEHHGFDTQGYAFRVLRNKYKILSTDALKYYRRLPKSPSYYLREWRDGNLNRNSFYVVVESLYKFSAPVRAMMMEFDYASPKQAALGVSAFVVLSRRAREEDVFSREAADLNDDAAYSLYSDSADRTLQAWCAMMDLQRNDIEGCLRRISQIHDVPWGRRMLYPLLARWSASSLENEDFDDLRYFIGRHKTATWKFRRTLQRVINRVTFRPRS